MNRLYEQVLRLPCDAPNNTRSYYRSVLNKFKNTQLVSNAEWSRPALMTDAYAAYNAFISIIQECQDLSTTLVKCHKNFAALHNPWLTDNLLSCMRKRDNLYKKTKRRPFNIPLKNRYKAYSQTLNKLLKESRRRYYESKINSAGCDAKQWKIINSFLNRDCQAVSINEILTSGKIYHSPQKIANILNDHFSSDNNDPVMTDASSFQRLPHSFFSFPNKP